MDLVRQAQMDILRYLIAHEDARDTLEGIDQWWLPRHRAYRLADISAALDLLEKSELIHVWRPARSQPIYGRAGCDIARLARHLGILASPQT